MQVFKHKRMGIHFIFKPTIEDKRTLRKVIKSQINS